MKSVFIMIVAVLITAKVFLPEQAKAQPPEKISYQLVVRDTANKLVSEKSIEIRISILKGSMTGVCVYMESQTRTSNTNGLVTLEIGSGTALLGSFPVINWGNGNYFIKTEIDPAGGSNYSITGTSQILSVPYALYAKNADNAKNTEHATNADSAKIAEYAKNTDSAKNADNAKNANHAINADSAKNAIYAKNTDAWSINGDNIYTTKSVSIGRANLLNTNFPKINVQPNDNGLEFNIVNALNNPSFTFKIGAQTIMAMYDINGSTVFFNNVSIHGNNSALSLDSPDGTTWYIQVDNSGKLNTTILAP